MTHNWIKYGLLILMIKLCSYCWGIEIPNHGIDTAYLSISESIPITISSNNRNAYNGGIRVISHEDNMLTISGHCSIDSLTGGSVTIYDGDRAIGTFCSINNIPTTRCYSGEIYIKYITSDHRTHPDNINITITACQAPQSINLLYHHQIDRNQVELLWNGWSGETTWRLMCKQANENNYFFDMQLPQNSYQLGNLIPNIDYTCRVYDIRDSLACGVSYTFQVQCDTSPICKSFTNLNACNINGSIGNYRNPFVRETILNLGPQSSSSRHTVHNDTSERDPRTNYLLRTIPPGETVSIRLGNWEIGAEAESIIYKYVVDTSIHNMLLLKYAAVLQSPHHSPVAQPRFKFHLLDENKLQINPDCYAADFIASDSLGWNIFNMNLWKDWTSVGINLDSLHGQTIYIQLITYDCLLGDHFGYAYFTLHCGNKVMTATSCGETNENTFTAPSGFTYKWYCENNPNQILGTSQSFHSSTPDIYKCDMTMISATETECKLTMTAIVGGRYPNANFSANQVGNPCNFAIQFRERSQVTSDEFHQIPSEGTCDEIWWDFGDGTTSNERNPLHLYTYNGTYIVTMIASMANGQCTDTICKNITVGTNCNYKEIYDTTCNPQYPFFDTILTSSGIYQKTIDSTHIKLYLTMYQHSHANIHETIVENQLPYTYCNHHFDTIINDTTIIIPNHLGCDSIIHYSLMVHYNKDTLIQQSICDKQLPYLWNNVTFTSQGQQSKKLITHHGADSLVNMILTVHLSYDSTITDYVCEGYTYQFEGNEYHLPGQYSITHLTQHQCDSTLTLHLTMHPTKDTTEYLQICNGHAIIWQDGNTYYAPTNTPTITYKANDGCDSIVHLVLDSSNVKAQCIANPQIITIENNLVTLIDNSIGNTSRWWYLPNTSSNEEQWVYHFPLSEDSVQVILIATNDYQCEDTAIVWLHKQNTQIWAPNVFTPDEETNNIFKIIGEGLLDIEVMIFNRNGQMVYHYQGLNHGWNGLSMQGIRCPQAAYVYKARYHFKSKPKQAKTMVGTITLLR